MRACLDDKISDYGAMAVPHMDLKRPQP